ARQAPDPEDARDEPTPRHAKADDAAHKGGLGESGAARVCGIVGLCVPVLGLVAIILGVVYLARPRTNGRGLAIGGIVTGVLGLLSTVALLLALLLPGLGRARQAARQVQSSAQMQQIANLLRSDAEEPAADASLESRYGLTADMWISPSADGGTRSYLRIVPDPAFAAIGDPILAEDPDVVDRRMLVVAYADGSISSIPRDEVIELLKAAGPRVRRTDGTPWAPAK
ncbi:MAG: DUF4190 domain-containing protein, partial [Phycisphaerales bacterium]